MCLLVLFTRCLVVFLLVLWQPTEPVLAGAVPLVDEGAVPLVKGGAVPLLVDDAVPLLVGGAVPRLVGGAVPVPLPDEVLLLRIGTLGAMLAVVQLLIGKRASTYILST